MFYFYVVSSADKGKRDYSDMVIVASMIKKTVLSVSKDSLEQPT